MPSWILLILTLPTENATARMRAWRALKAAGAAVLRDGVYVLPAREAQRAVFESVAAEVEASGGSAYVFDLAPEAQAPFATLFDRTADYERLAAEIAASQQDVDNLAAPDLARQARKLRKAFDALSAIDFFPGQAQAHTGALLDALDEAVRARVSPGEPTPRATAIERRDPARYAGRLWATRRRPWVDRLASAWLIRRCIDPQARFIWLDSPADCPADAVGFDFDGAEFSHVGEKVSFETLLAAFDLEADAALARIGRIVHVLDVGGLPVAEAAGLETVLAGMRASLADDSALLEAALGVFDFLHTALKARP